MSKLRIANLIKVDERSVTPKYLQIAYGVVREIENGRIKAGENIPSINELSKELNIARDTVERAYKHLKQTNVIESLNRKGYYVKNIEFRKPLKLFLLPNKLSASKKAIYDSFVAALGEHAFVDFCIYNDDFSLFKKLIAGKKEDYTACIIVPHFVTSEKKVNKIIDIIPKEKSTRLVKAARG